jgi:hypothetical protein
MTTYHTNLSGRVKGCGNKKLLTIQYVENVVEDIGRFAWGRFSYPAFLVQNADNYHLMNSSFALLQIYDLSDS